MGIIEIKEKANGLLGAINQLEVEQQASLVARLKIEDSINKLLESNKSNKEALDIATHAIEILRQVSDGAVAEAYKFLEGSLNNALERMFEHTTRRVSIREYTRNNQYPQLEIELIVGGGKKRSLKTDSGHGIAQIVSLLSILSLIVLTNSRRILVMDEVISGLSVHNRKIVTDILWQFTEIGFQFIVNEHGYIPKGSKVYHLEMLGDVSSIKQTYIEQKGVYLAGEASPSQPVPTKPTHQNQVNHQNQVTQSTQGIPIPSGLGVGTASQVPKQNHQTQSTQQTQVISI